MNIEDLRVFCLALPHTSEGFPFDEDTLVFKVAGKMFCLASLQASDRINLKCDPEKAIELRPKHTETQDILLRLQTEQRDWKGARATLGAKLKAGTLPKDVYRRRDAVLALWRKVMGDA